GALLGNPEVAGSNPAPDIPFRPCVVDRKVNAKQGFITREPPAKSMALRAVLASVFVAVLLLGGAVSYIVSVSPDVGLDSFGSRGAFHAYLDSLRHADGSGLDGFRWAQGNTLGDIATAAETLDAGEFSGTNVQVAGVDEADIMKTDGELIYVGLGEEVVLIRAHPPEMMGIVSRIPFDTLGGDDEEQVRVLGLFLHEDILVVISGLYPGYGVPQIQPALDFRMSGVESRTLVSLFSVADPADPERLRVFEVTGSYSASRLKDAVIYLVLQQPLYAQGEEGSYPVICVDLQCQPFDATRIYYDPEAPEVGTLTNVVAIDVQTGAVGYLSLLTGYASTVYMSLDSLYVTFAKWGNVGEALPRSELFLRDTAFTSIYRIAVEGIDLFPTSGGNVKGWLLNQFSMDEHRGYLRVATTIWDASVNSVYVLDPDLHVVGALEGLAPGETIYSARFIGELGYLVTFQKVDPFFVLDLSNPTDPSVLGYLKIPGFSDYLHPIDATHILGVGKETIEDPSGEFAWFQGLKLSLFDVTDLAAPKEVAKYLAGDRGSSSPVLYDHKAFLYMEEEGFVILPVQLVELVEADDGRPPWEYGEEHWLGALVLSIDAGSGFELQTRITHQPEGEDACRWASPFAVLRSAYIGEYLYTLSPTILKAHSLDGFEEVGSLTHSELSTDTWC
ncbi:MAG: beta-propeller domain-containing protein, partial [Thermoplasmata archaeon]